MQSYFSNSGIWKRITMDSRQVSNDNSNGFRVMKDASECNLQDGYHENLNVREERVSDISDKGLVDSSERSVLKPDIEGLIAQGHASIDDDDDDAKGGIEDSASEIRDASFSHSSTKRNISAHLEHQSSKLEHASKQGVSITLNMITYADSDNAKNQSLKPVAVRNSRSDSTVLQTFNLTTKTSAVDKGQLGDREYGQHLKMSQRLGSKLHSKAPLSSSLDSDLQKVMPNTNKQALEALQVPKPTSSPTAGIKLFKLQSDERAEKRKEFYSKLLEKVNAKEDEKAQMQLKMKKELEEEIKILRKRLEFKASPMPNFYQESPIKLELPKIPPTRAKSPNFSRRRGHPRVLGRHCNCCTDCETEHGNSNSRHKPAKVHDAAVCVDDCSKFLMGPQILSASSGEKISVHKPHATAITSDAIGPSIILDGCRS